MVKSNRYFRAANAQLSALIGPLSARLGNVSLSDTQAKVHAKSRRESQQVEMHELDDEPVAARPECRLRAAKARPREAFSQVLSDRFGLQALQLRVHEMGSIPVLRIAMIDLGRRGQLTLVNGCFGTCARRKKHLSR